MCIAHINVYVEKCKRDKASIKKEVGRKRCKTTVSFIFCWPKICFDQHRTCFMHICKILNIDICVIEFVVLHNWTFMCVCAWICVCICIPFLEYDYKKKSTLGKRLTQHRRRRDCHAFCWFFLSSSSFGHSFGVVGSIARLNILVVEKTEITTVVGRFFVILSIGKFTILLDYLFALFISKWSVIL